MDGIGIEPNERQNSNSAGCPKTFGDDNVSLANYLSVISKYRKMILRICGITMVMTVIITVLSPKMYSATTSIVPPLEMLQGESKIAEGLGMRSPMLSQVMGTASIADLYIGMLKSRAIEDAIINRFDLLKVYDVKERIAARSILQENVAIEASKEGIVHITAKDTDPNRAAAMANAYVEELDEQNKRLSSGQATSKRIFLGNRLKEIEGKLGKIDNILSREARIQEMLFELLTREYEIAKMEEAKSMPTIQVLDKAIVPEAKLPRRTKVKTITAGGIALVLAASLAFVREYLAKRSH
jgi:uncharacterized protein involved in exopolysaccharide biosynthesis